MYVRRLQPLGLLLGAEDVLDGKEQSQVFLNLPDVFVAVSHRAFLEVTDTRSYDSAT
jgi:hypothetical protein